MDQRIQNNYIAISWFNKEKRNTNNISELVEIIIGIEFKCWLCYIILWTIFGGLLNLIQLENKYIFNKIYNQDEIVLKSSWMDINSGPDLSETTLEFKYSSSQSFALPKISIKSVILLLPLRRHRMEKSQRLLSFNKRLKLSSSSSSSLEDGKENRPIFVLP